MQPILTDTGCIINLNATCQLNYRRFIAVSLAHTRNHVHALDMETKKSSVNTNKDFSETDIERLKTLLEWGAMVHKDLGDFVGAMDRFLLEKASEGKPPARDFLTAVKKTANRG